MAKRETSIAVTYASLVDSFPPRHALPARETGRSFRPANRYLADDAAFFAKMNQCCRVDDATTVALPWTMTVVLSAARTKDAGQKGERRNVGGRRTAEKKTERARVRERKREREEAAISSGCE